MNYREIIKCFKFDIDDKEIFQYIKSYSSKMENWLESNKLNENQIFKYMLIGFFLDYRSANHHGESFNTFEKSSKENNISRKEVNDLISKITKNTIPFEIKNNDLINKKLLKRNKRCKIFNSFYGKAIISTEEYINLVNIDLTTEDLGNELFNFVIR